MRSTPVFYILQSPPGSYLKIPGFLKNPGIWLVIHQASDSVSPSALKQPQIPQRLDRLLIHPPAVATLDAEAAFPDAVQHTPGSWKTPNLPLSAPAQPSPGSDGCTETDLADTPLHPHGATEMAPGIRPQSAEIACWSPLCMTAKAAPSSLTNPHLADELENGSGLASGNRPEHQRFLLPHGAETAAERTGNSHAQRR